jgi:hypothetical protein
MSPENQKLRRKQRRYIKDLYREAIESNGDALEKLSNIALGGDVFARRLIRRQERSGPFPIRAAEDN